MEQPDPIHVRGDLPTKPIHRCPSVIVHIEGYLPRPCEVNVDVEGVLNVNRVPHRRGSQKGVSPVTTNLSTDVRENRCDVRSEGVDVGEELGWELVDGRKGVSHRSEGAGSFDQAYFNADDLRSRVSRVFVYRGTTEGFWGVPLRGKGPNPHYRSQSLSARVLGEGLARTNSMSRV